VANRKSRAPAKRKRKRGRPHASQAGVGREGIVAAGRKLLETHLPHRVTTLMVAREAGVDPALIRYYFSSREELFMAITEDIVVSWVAAHPPPNSNPAEKLAMQVRGMVDFARTARSMQRLMIDEVAEARSPEIRRRVRELNARAVEAYAALFNQNDPDPLVPSDPLLAYVAIIGMAEFFVAAQSMIVPLLPQKTSADELAERYKTFIVNLVLNGLRPRREK
jgi:AcrR family transcriptional regulator